MERYAELIGNYKKQRIKSLYGNKLKVGKTTFARDMGALILSFENGTRALSGAYAMPMKSWTDMKTVVRYCKDAAFKARYKAIAIDTADLAAAACEKYVCAQLNIESLGEGGWSNNGWAVYKKELSEAFRTISNEGYALLFISHARDREIKNLDGTSYHKMCPTLSESSNRILKGMSDIIAYAYQEPGTDNRVMVLRSDSSIEVGSRFPYIEERIPFSYKNLEEALGKAIDEEARVNGLAAVSAERRAERNEELPSFEDLQGQFKILIEELLQRDSGNSAKITQIVETYLGRGKKFSEATPTQVEHMSLIVDELKELID